MHKLYNLKSVMSRLFYDLNGANKIKKSVIFIKECGIIIPDKKSNFLCGR